MSACLVNALFSKLQERHDLQGRDQKGEAFIELLLVAWNSLSSSDKKKWEAQAQEIDDAEFTALLDEEWEKLSAKEQKNAASEARLEIEGGASATAAKQVWARNKKALAKEMEIKAQNKSEGPRKKNIFSRPQSATKHSQAFKEKVRVACRRTVSGGLCLATDNYRSLAL